MSNEQIHSVDPFYILDALHKKGDGECGLVWVSFNTGFKGWYVWFNDERDTHETELHDTIDGALSEAEERWL